MTLIRLLIDDRTLLKGTSVQFYQHQITIPISPMRPLLLTRLPRAVAPLTALKFPAANQWRSVSNCKHSPISSVPLGALTNTNDSNVGTIGQNKSIYSAQIDQASSQFSPTPTRLIRGDEDSDIIPAALTSGAPIELQARTVRIHCSTKPATQSGNWHGQHWRMDWDILPKGHRWENPLMGWQSSADFMQGTHINFKTKEDAVRFAEKQGYEYIVQEPNHRKIVPKAYANNFLWSDRKLKHIRTK